MMQQTNISGAPPVTILMGVRNGAAFLPAQLRSISAQTHGNWQLLCSDDGSSDETPRLIGAFARDHPGRVNLRNGPQRGFAANYLSMIRALPPDPTFVSLADQDDVWLPEKLARASSFTALNSDQPMLYCGRQFYWYPAREKSVPSPSCRRPCTMRNALAENVATGHTIVLNPAAARLARAAARRTEDVFAHDWWLYLLVTACGGKVVFDNGPPQVLYRQHARNTIGVGRSASVQLCRKIGVLQGRFQQRIQQNIDALRAVEDMMTEEGRAILDRFEDARQQKGLRRIAALHQLRPYRQRYGANLGFWGAVGLDRV